ncbi:MAG TPA: DUF924 domain-containing protein [Rhodospirillaceae bacterium]|nr:DUF924 domain-containing protein [Rhodospirillaceae bacterium]
MTIDPEEILKFWFYDIGPSRWFTADPEIDETIKSKFLEAYQKAAREELGAWEETPEGMISLLLLLDTFSRRMFHGTAQAYETDDLALDLARGAIVRHFDDRIDRTFKLFFYMPFTHSEQIGDQRLASFYVRERTKEKDWVDFVDRRRQIVERFGRFPHRNAFLNRETTPEEAAYLQKQK